MTDKERIEMLEKVKVRIANGEETFICNGINILLKNYSYSNMFKVFPELEKHKPKNHHLHGAWFGDKSGKYTRLKVLNSMITEIKTKSND